MLLRRDGRVVGAEILDYKTDAVQVSDGEAIAAKAAHYRPQMDAYRAAIASGYGLDLEAVTASLLVLEAGSVVTV